MGSLALASGRGYPTVSLTDDEELLRRQIVEVVNNLMNGKSNNTGSFTITANAATTTLSDARIGANSTILIMPTTSNAAGALASTYFDTFGDGSCTVNHANNAQADRTFRYAVIG